MLQSEIDALFKAIDDESKSLLGQIRGHTYYDKGINVAGGRKITHRSYVDRYAQGVEKSQNFRYAKLKSQSDEILSILNKVQSDQTRLKDRIIAAKSRSFGKVIKGKPIVNNTNIIREAVKMADIPDQSDLEAIKSKMFLGKVERDMPIYANKVKNTIRAGQELKGIGSWSLKQAGKGLSKKNLAYITMGALGAALTIGLIKELHDSKEYITSIDRNQSNKDREYSDFGSPVNLSRVIDRGSRVMRQLPRTILRPTMGLTQQLHKQAINHTLQGNMKIQDQFNRLFNFNNNY